METKYFVIAYGIYLPVTILLTWYVARVLFSSGKVFMIDIFRGREEIALGTNQLFKVGFYLLNIGFAMMIMKIDRTEITAEMLRTNPEMALNSTRDLMEILSWKIGGFSIYLGLMLFFNLYLFFRGKRKSKESQLRELQFKTVEK